MRVTPYWSFCRGGNLNTSHLIPPLRSLQVSITLFRSGNKIKIKHKRVKIMWEWVVCHFCGLYFICVFWIYHHAMWLTARSLERIDTSCVKTLHIPDGTIRISFSLDHSSDNTHTRRACYTRHVTQCMRIGEPNWGTLLRIIWQSHQCQRPPPRCHPLACNASPKLY